jgi:hypothetical protein
MPSFQENFTAWSDVFLVHVATRYRIKVSELRADWRLFVAGTLEPLGVDPVPTATSVDPKNTSKTITSLQHLDTEESADEIKTRVTNPDDNSEAPDDAVVAATGATDAVQTSQQQASAKTAENDGSSSTDEDDDVVVDDETPTPQPAVKNAKAPDAPKKGKGKKEEVVSSSSSSSEEDEVVVEGSSSDDESEPPEPIVVAAKGKKGKAPVAKKAAPKEKAKPAAKGKAPPKKEPTPEPSEEETSGSGSQDSGSSGADDDEDEDIVVESEEEAPPAKKGKKAPATTNVGGRGKAATAKKPDALVLSDTPKLAVADRPTIPKGMKFVKGTNYVVFEGTVVAACTKKGIVQLTTVNTKALDNKGTAYDSWTNDKIKKTKKWVA